MNGKDKGARMNLMQISKSISNQKNEKKISNQHITIKKCSIIKKNSNKDNNSHHKIIFRHENASNINGDSMLNFTQLNKENLENYDPSLT